MITKLRATLALAVAATFAVGSAFAQAPAQAPAAAPMAAAPAAAPAKPADDIVETANKAGNFKTLIKALDAADMTKVLKGKGPFTVFAPTDEAFAKLTKEQLEELFTPKYKVVLAQMLGAHVLVNKTLKSDRIVAAKAFHAKMRNSSLVAIDGKDPKAIKFGTGTVTKADIEASNGIVHVVDTVYLPRRVRAALYTIEKAQKAKAAAGPALEKAKEVGSKALEKTKEVGGKAVEKAKEVGGKAIEVTKDAAGKAVEKAKEATGTNTPATPAPATK